MELKCIAIVSFTFAVLLGIMRQFKTQDLVSFTFAVLMGIEVAFAGGGD